MPTEKLAAPGLVTVRENRSASNAFSRLNQPPAVAVHCSALADGPTFNYRVRDKLLAGEGNPSITLVPNGTVKQLRLTLTRRGAKKRVFKSGRLPAGPAA